MVGRRGTALVGFVLQVLQCLRVHAAIRGEKLVEVYPPANLDQAFCTSVGFVDDKRSRCG